MTSTASILAKCLKAAAQGRTRLVLEGTKLTPDVRADLIDHEVSSIVFLKPEYYWKKSSKESFEIEVWTTILTW